MMKRLLLYCLTYSLLMLFGAQAAIAQEEGRALEIAQDVTVIYETVSVPFEPREVVLILETGLGKVSHYRGVSVAKHGRELAQEGRLSLLGAAFPKSVLSKHRKRFHFTFLLLGDDRKIALTPVDVRTRKMLEKHGKPGEEILRSIEGILEDLEATAENDKEITSQFAALRGQASSIAGVNEIIDLKMQLTHLEGFGKNKTVEKERLDSLVELGRNLEEPADIDERVKELSVHLREAARATAMADRLNARRKASARANLKRKLDVIKKYKNVDSERLAQQVLSLRAERRSLERRLRSSAAQPIGDSEF